MKHLLLLGGIIGLFISMIGCEDKPKASTAPEPTVVSNVTRVFMHETHRFTFLVKHPGIKKVGQLRVQAVDPDLVTLLEDLKEDEPIRIEYSCGKPGNLWQCRTVPPNFNIWNVSPRSLIIHLHSAKEIDGAGWYRGGKQSRSGQTVVIE